MSAILVQAVFNTLGFEKDDEFSSEEELYLTNNNFIDDYMSKDENYQTFKESFKDTNMRILIEKESFFTIKFRYHLSTSVITEENLARHIQRENCGFRGAKITYYKHDAYYTIDIYRQFLHFEINILIDYSMEKFLQNFYLHSTDKFLKILREPTPVEFDPFEWNMQFIPYYSIDRDINLIIESFRDHCVKKEIELLKYDYATISLRPKFLSTKKEFVVLKFFPEFGYKSYILILDVDKDSMDPFQINEFNQKIRFGKIEVVRDESVVIQLETLHLPESDSDIRSLDFSIDLLEVIYKEYKLFFSNLA